MHIGAVIIIWLTGLMDQFTFFYELVCIFIYFFYCDTVW
jgi:hypothetical protein